MSAMVSSTASIIVASNVRSQVNGPRLPYPHSSAVKAADKLCELRTRGGRSVTRALYRRIGDAFIIGAHGPGAQHDPRGFARSCSAAERRLDEIEE